MSNNSYAKVIADSIGPNGVRLTSVEVRYWRAIHSEIMTHRDRARNAASSRAIPFIRKAKGRLPAEQIRQKGGVIIGVPDSQETYEYYVSNCTYSMIKNDPCIPEFIGNEQPGMQSGSELDEPFRSSALGEIYDLRDKALATALRLYELGVHKSIINRYLEPWSYITVIMTATEWKNFFRLRIHPKAEKHFCKVATQIKEAMNASTPTVLGNGEWHLPYLLDEEKALIKSPNCAAAAEVLKIEEKYLWGESIISILKRISAARCARLSYLNHDGIKSGADDIRIFNSLIHPKIEQDRDDDVIHSSPLEHVAMASTALERSGPFVGWFQFRKEFSNENVEG